MSILTFFRIFSGRICQILKTWSRFLWNTLPCWKMIYTNFRVEKFLSKRRVPVGQIWWHTLDPNMLPGIPSKIPWVLSTVKNWNYSWMDWVDLYGATWTVPGYVSWRDTERGSWFMQAIVYVFQKWASQEDLLSMMTEVNRIVQDKFNTRGPADFEVACHAAVRGVTAHTRVTLHCWKGTGKYQQ